jgi:hypothetical protein
MNTTLGDKLRKAGYLPREVRFSIALSEFLNNGGTIERAHALVDQAAEQMQGNGQVLPTAQTSITVPDALQTYGDKGRVEAAARAMQKVPASPNPLGKGLTRDAEKANIAAPVSSTHPPEQGHLGAAEKAIRIVPRSGGPGHSRRGLAAIASVQGTIARSLFERTRLPDGRTLREVRWSELPRLAREYRSLSRVFTAIYKHAVPSDPSVTIDLIVKESELQEILTNVERFNDIH